MNLMMVISDILVKMKQNPKEIRFNHLCIVCDHFFGEARQMATSHRIYKTLGKEIHVLIFKTQKEKAKLILDTFEKVKLRSAKRFVIATHNLKIKIPSVYQVKQVLKAIEKLEDIYDKDS